MYSMWLTEEQQRIWRAYLTMASRLQNAMNRQLQRDCELSLADYDVLVVLSERGPQRMRDLGEVLAWEQSRVSHQLRRMGGRGLVERHGSDDDRRGATVELTANGRAALQTAAAGHAELVRTTVFDGLSDAQLKTFESVLDRITSRLR
jgi:DNA-binding MarR family transcriptional regulator